MHTTTKRIEGPRSIRQRAHPDWPTTSSEEKGQLGQFVTAFIAIAMCQAHADDQNDDDLECSVCILQTKSVSLKWRESPAS